MELKELRISKGLTQKEAADILGISLRTFQNHEYGVVSSESFVHREIVNELLAYQPYSFDRGIYSIDELVKIIVNVLSTYHEREVGIAYLFGDYPLGKATEKSHVSIMIRTIFRGRELHELEAHLRESLHKVVDVVTFESAMANFELMTNILKTGQRIYG